ncbi:hypothetical protein BpHYR1_030822, partial [Brachionus plicatilis]
MSSVNYPGASHETNSDSFIDITNSSNHDVMFIDDNLTSTSESIDVKSYVKLSFKKEQHLDFDNYWNNDIYMNNLFDFFSKYEKNDHYLQEVIPKMADLALDLPNIVKLIRYRLIKNNVPILANKIENLVLGKQEKIIFSKSRRIEIYGKSIALDNTRKNVFVNKALIARELLGKLFQQKIVKDRKKTILLNMNCVLWLKKWQCEILVQKLQYK